MHVVRTYLLTSSDRDPANVKAFKIASLRSNLVQVYVASILDETCQHNTHVWCWTGHDGQGTMCGNAGVCRVMDYPEPRSVHEPPRDNEDPMYW